MLADRLLRERIRKSRSAQALDHLEEWDKWDADLVPLERCVMCSGWHSSKVFRVAVVCVGYGTDRASCAIDGAPQVTDIVTCLCCDVLCRAVDAVLSRSEPSGGRLIVVANRLPVTCSKVNNRGAVTKHAGSGHAAVMAVISPNTGSSSCMFCVRTTVGPRCLLHSIPRIRLSNSITVIAAAPPS